MTHIKFLKYYLVALSCLLRARIAPSKVTYRLRVDGEIRRKLTLNRLLKYNIPLLHLKDYVELQHEGTIDTLPYAIQGLLIECQYEGTIRGLELSQFIANERALTQPQTLLLLLLVEHDHQTIYATVHTEI